MICEKCQAPITEGKKFCGQCGTPVNIVSESSSSSSRCLGCGKDLAPGKKFCGACGRPVPQEEVATPIAAFSTVAVPANILAPEPPVQPELEPQVRAEIQPQIQTQVSPQLQPQPEAHGDGEKTGFQNVQVLPAPDVTPKQKSGSTLIVLAIIVVVLLGMGTYFGMQLFSSTAGKTGTRKDTTGASAGVMSSSPSSQPGSDSQLTEDIENALQGEPALASESIRIRATRGVVTMDGSVSNLAARALAERKVNQVKGVRTLIDNLTITK